MLGFLNFIAFHSNEPLLLHAHSASWLTSTSLLFQAAWFNFSGFLPQPGFDGTLLTRCGTLTACVAGRVGTGQLATW